MKMRRLTRTAIAAVLYAAGVVTTSIAGVITGTGTAPSATHLGATNATAYRISPSNTGHMLLVPYFTAQNGQMTVMHLVNTDSSNGKVIRLRFRGAHNGDSLLSMHVILSPRDVWTGAVAVGADGKAQLTTFDKSCTLPQLQAGIAQPFLIDRLAPTWSSVQQANHTREGSVEAIVMADVPNSPLYGVSGQERSALYNATRQVNGIAPCTPSVLEATLQTDTSDEASASSRGLATPTGKVGATWYVMDVPGATTFSAAATAIEAVTAAGSPARGNYVLFPATNLGISEPERFTSDPLLVSQGLAFRSKQADGTTGTPTTSAVVQARAYDLPDLSTPYYLPAGAANAQRTAAALSQVLSTPTVMNQYAVDPSISAQTDWLVALPTKRYSIALDYTQSNATLASVYSVVPPAGAGAQFFHSGNTAAVPKDSGPLISCSYSTVSYLVSDRDATTQVPGPVLIVPPPEPVLCGMTPVLTFGGAASALSASVTRTSWPNSYTNGWAQITTSNPTGVPATGAAFIKLVNPNATPGISGRYGLLYPHMTERP